ncbi:MAG: hypothetical protein ACREBU_15420 [Nitrososphaera sp.]
MNRREALFSISGLAAPSIGIANAQTQLNPEATTPAPPIDPDEYLATQKTLPAVVTKSSVKDLIPKRPPDCPQCDYAVAWSDFVVVVNQDRVTPGKEKKLEDILGERFDPKMTMDELMQKLKNKGYGSKAGFVDLRTGTLIER